MLIFLLSFHQLYGNPTCRAWTSYSKLKIHFFRHCSPQPLRDCCAMSSPIPHHEQKKKKSKYSKNQTFKAFYESDTQNIRTHIWKCAHCIQPENLFRVEFSQNPYRSNVQKSSRNFLHTKVLSCRLPDL